MNKLVAILIAFVAAFLTGCSTSKQQGSIMPGADLRSVKTYYVVRLPADNRGIEKLIAEDLTARGYKATHGEMVNVPTPVDALVTYQDKWMWDLSMYLLQLEVQIRNPQSQLPLATGSSLRTSLARKAPPLMVKEVLDQIYSKVPAPTATSLGSN